MGRREHLMVLLTDKTRQLGRVVTFEEMRCDPKMPSPNDYAFYSGSFVLAAEDAWARVCREKEKGDGVMAKTKRPVWEHTPEEMMELALKKCDEAGKIPSRRSWTHDSFINFNELVALVGNGDWQRAESRIRKAWLERCAKAIMKSREQRMADPEVAEVSIEPEKPVEEAFEPEVPVEVLTEPEVLVETPVEPETKLPVKARKSRQRWTKVECLDFLRKEYERLGRLPMQKEINEKSAAGEGPSYATLLKYLGEKKGWLKLLGVC